MTLANAVAWSAIVACLVSVVSAVLGGRAASRAHRESREREKEEAYERGKASMVDLLEQCRSERDYWRGEIVRRINGH